MVVVDVRKSNASYSPITISKGFLSSDIPDGLVPSTKKIGLPNPYSEKTDTPNFSSIAGKLKGFGGDNQNNPDFRMKSLSINKTTPSEFTSFVNKFGGVQNMQPIITPLSIK